MGADLCGYIMVGPQKLDPKKVRKVKKLFGEMMGVVEKEVLPELEKLEEEASLAEVSKRLHVRFNKLVKASPGDARCYVQFCVREASQAGLFREKVEETKTLPDGDLVDSFVEMWNGGGYRDRMDRRWEWKKIVVVGERTWGDGPEAGSAWGLTDLMFFWGLLADLGIE